MAREFALHICIFLFVALLCLFQEVASPHYPRKGAESHVPRELVYKLPRFFSGSALYLLGKKQIGSIANLGPLSGPLRLRVQSRSRTRLRIAASIAFLFRTCFKGILDTIAPLSRG